MLERDRDEVIEDDRLCEVCIEDVLVEDVEDNVLLLLGLDVLVLVLLIDVVISSIDWDMDDTVL